MEASFAKSFAVGQGIWRVGGRCKSRLNVRSQTLHLRTLGCSQEHLHLMHVRKAISFLPSLPHPKEKRVLTWVGICYASYAVGTRSARPPTEGCHVISCQVIPAPTSLPNWSPCASVQAKMKCIPFGKQVTVSAHCREMCARSQGPREGAVPRGRKGKKETIFYSFTPAGHPFSKERDDPFCRVWFL